MCHDEFSKIVELLEQVSQVSRLEEEDKTVILKIQEKYHKLLQLVSEPANTRDQPQQQPTTFTNNSTASTIPPPSPITRFEPPSEAVVASEQPQINESTPQTLTQPPLPNPTTVTNNSTSSTSNRPSQFRATQSELPSETIDASNRPTSNETNISPQTCPQTPPPNQNSVNNIPTTSHISPRPSPFLDRQSISSDNDDVPIVLRSKSKYVRIINSPVNPTPSLTHKRRQPDEDAENNSDEDHHPSQNQTDNDSVSQGEDPAPVPNLRQLHFQKKKKTNSISYYPRKTPIRNRPNSYETPPATNTSLNSSVPPTPTLIKRDASLPPELIEKLNNSTVAPRYTKSDASVAFGYAQIIILLLPKIMIEANYPWKCGKQDYYRDSDYFLKLCTEENILNIPPNEVMLPIADLDLESVEAARSVRRNNPTIHPLARIVQDSINPSPKAFQNLSRMLKDLCYLNTEKQGIPPDTFSNITDPDQKVHEAHNYLQKWFNNLYHEEDSLGGFFCVMEYFLGALAGLCSLYATFTQAKRPNKKVDGIKQKHQDRQIAMLANLLVFGPSAIFKASTDREVQCDWKGLLLIRFGSMVLQDHFKHHPREKIAPHPFHKTRIYFLQFLADMGFEKQSQPDEVFPPIDWEKVIKVFHERFSMKKIVELMQVDLEWALESHNTHNPEDALPF